MHRLVMVTNQNALGSSSFPWAAFNEAHEFVLDALRSQGIRFEKVFVCPHSASGGAASRAPGW